MKKTSHSKKNPYCVPMFSSLGTKNELDYINAVIDTSTIDEANVAGSISDIITLGVTILE